MSLANYSRLSFAYFLLTGLLSAQTTAPTITQVVARPESVPAGIATSVTVLCVIDSPNVIPGSVVVQKLNSASQVIGTYGVLADNGFAPDATANDQVFSGRIQVYETDPGSVQLRVSAGLRGSLQRLVSTPIPVTVTGANPVSIQIQSPTNFAYFNLSPVTVTGVVGAGTTSVQINGVNAVLNGATFSAAVPLVEGSNTLAAVATGANGATASTSTTVTLDTTPPRVTILNPAAGFTTSDPAITISGLVNDIVVGTVNATQATVLVNGVAAAVSNRSFTAPDVPLAVGTNTIQAVGRDRAGNTYTTSVVVNRVAPQGPRLTLISGNNQTGPVNTLLPAPLVVKAVDANGAPLPNRSIVFRVIENNGLVNNAVSVAVNTNMQGQAETRLLLGSRSGSGNNAVEAFADGLAGPITFRASSTANQARKIVVDSGLNQTGVVGADLPFPLIAVVTDAQNNRLANVPVRFRIAQGNGKLYGQTILNTVSDGDGRVSAVLTLGLDEGQSNNVVEASLPSVTGAPVAVFSSSALAPGRAEETRITGVVLDNANNPIPNVTIRMFRLAQGVTNGQPQQIGTPVQTDARGQFLVNNAPVGALKLMADGSTAAPSGGWPTLEYDLVTVAGRENTVGTPIYLPALDRVNRLCVSAAQGGTLTLPQYPGFSLTVQAGSATFPGGSRSGCISVTPVNPDKVPMAPGFGQQPRFVVTIQPVGTQFNPPAQLTIPNLDGLQPREKTEMYSFDHDLASFVSIGTGTVSLDGSVIASDPGVGVIKAGWHCGGNPNPTGTAGTCPQCQRCQNGGCVAAAGTCDDNNACTQNDRCVNGSCQGDPVDTSTWSERVVGGGDYRLPDGVKGKFESALRAIGINVTLREIRVGAQGRQKNCCGPQTGVQQGGLVEEQATLQFVVSLQRIPIPGLSTPTISREIDFGIAIISIDFQVGASADINFRLNGSVGRRIDACNPGNNCTYGEVNGSIDFDPGFTVEAIACLETLWTTKTCGGVTIRPLALRISIRGGVSYNKPDCNSGVTGFVKLGRVALRIEFNIDIPARPTRAVIEVELYGGGEF